MEDLDKQLNMLKNIHELLAKYTIELGVVSENSDRDDNDVTNAELMFIHENGTLISTGSGTTKIPSRPVLDMTLQYARKKIIHQSLSRIYDGIINKSWNEQDVEKELEKACVRIQTYAQKMIYNNDGRLQRNAESTIKSKGFNHPLFVTGELARSITCRLVKK